ncbi:MAG: DUF4091 domain-containing protein, partial [Planctomycetota bacterium]
LVAEAGGAGKHQVGLVPEPGGSARLNDVACEGLDGLQVDCWLEDYVEVTQPSHDEPPPGRYPDALLPVEPTDLAETRAVWVRIGVPQDAGPGAREGKAVLSFDDGPVEVPVALTVRNFALPADPPTLVMAYGLYEQKLRAKYPDRYDEMLGRFKGNLREHRNTHLAFPATDIPVPDISFGDAGLAMDFDAFDAAVEENLAHGMNALDVPLPVEFNGKTIELETEYSDEQLKQIAAGYESHLADRGWLDMAYFFIIDEPGRKHFDAVKRYYGLLKEAAPRIKRRCDFGYGGYGGHGAEVEQAAYRELADSITIWCPHIDCLDDEFLRERQAAGDEVWWYICCSAKHPYPNFLIDYPNIDSRVPFWMLWKYGATGFAYWTVNWWNEDPFTDPHSYPHAVGDGMLVYPGSDGPVNSIRWEITLEGAQDYEYLALLDRLAGEDEHARAALARVEDVARSTTEYTTDPAVLLSAREEVGDAIEALAG